MNTYRKVEYIKGRFTAPNRANYGLVRYTEDETEYTLPFEGDEDDWEGDCELVLGCVDQVILISTGDEYTLLESNAGYYITSKLETVSTPIGVIGIIRNWKESFDVAM